MVKGLQSVLGFCPNAKSLLSRVKVFKAIISIKLNSFKGISHFLLQNHAVADSKLSSSGQVKLDQSLLEA